MQTAPAHTNLSAVRYRWTDCLREPAGRGAACNSMVVGVLAGHGIGPEVIGAAVKVFEAIAKAADIKVDIRHGGAIGQDAEKSCGRVLPDDVVQFCEKIFACGGAILNGAAGGRYVYEVRRQFDMFFKISPIRIVNGLVDASRLKSESLRNVDILIVRENTGGAYQGSWSLDVDDSQRRHATHWARYSEWQVRRFLEAAAQLAVQRRGQLTIVWKESGIPSISRLWRDCAAEVADKHRIRFAMVDCDLMAYRLIQNAAEFDVVAAPNLFGDILGDLGAVLLGSRGISYSGNYNASGHAIYQTNHGAAHDLAGTDRANPVGQILSVAMMLRETFGQWRMAEAVEHAVRIVWGDGYRTEDVATVGARVIGTQEMGDFIAGRVADVLQSFSD